MFNYRIIIACTLVLVGMLFTVTFSQEAASAFWGITDSLAQPSFKRWTRSEEQAKLRYTREVTAANRKLRDELIDVQQRLVQAGELEGAIKVKAAIDELGQGKWPTGGPAAHAEAQPNENELLRPALARKLHGTTWRNKGGQTLTFDARDMSVKASWHRHVGTWVVLSDNTMRFSGSMSSCHSDIRTVLEDGKRMVNSQGEINLILVQ